MPNKFTNINQNYQQNDYAVKSSFFYKMGAIMRKLKMADTFQEEKAEKKK